MFGHVLIWLVTTGLLPKVYCETEEVIQYSGSMSCQGECSCSGLPDCPCSLSCPMATSLCAPGFTQVCQQTNEKCPPGMVALCPQKPTTTTPTTTTTTTPSPPKSISGEKVSNQKVSCGSTTFKCSFTANYVDNCSKVTKVTPSCTPKKKLCKRGGKISYSTKKGKCKVTGTLTISKKYKQSVSKKGISGPPATKPPTTTTTTTTTPAPSPPGDHKCECVPDFVVLWMQVGTGIPGPFPCCCIPRRALA